LALNNPGWNGCVIRLYSLVDGYAIISCCGCVLVLKKLLGLGIIRDIFISNQMFASVNASNVLSTRNCWMSGISYAEKTESRRRYRVAIGREYYPAGNARFC
jgi:hypothetical protein